MLPTNKDPEISIIPPKIRLLYTDFKLVSEAHYFKIFSAKSISRNKSFTLRVLDFNSEFYKCNSNIAATLFVQELLRLSTLYPDTVLIEDFEICDKAVAFVTSSYLPLSHLIKEDKGPQNIDMEKLIQDVLTDLNFLVFDMGLSSKDSKSSIIQTDFENIYQISDNNKFFLGDWAKGLETVKALEGLSEVNMKESDDDLKGEKEIQTFAFKMLELCGVKNEDIQDIMYIKNPKVFMAGLDALLSGLELQSESLKKTLRSLLTKDGDTKKRLANFSSTKRKEAKEETKLVDPPLSKDHIIPNTLAKLSRLEFRPDGFWSYSSTLNIDGVAFKVSSNIQITGVGLWIPQNKGTLKGTVKIVESEKIEGKVLASKAVELCQTMPEVKNYIFPLMFENHIDILADKSYSIVSEFERGPISYKGRNGKAKVQVNEKITFEFSKCEGAKNGTNIEIGQFPEIYFSY